MDGRRRRGRVPRRGPREVRGGLAPRPAPVAVFVDARGKRMAWVLSRRLPVDLVRLVESFASERVVLCRCAKCGLALLTQHVEPHVRAGDVFTHSVCRDRLAVAVTHDRRAYLDAAPLPEPHCTLVARDAEARCERTPRWIEVDGRAFHNRRPRMRLLCPFTRLGDAAVCVMCRGEVQRVRSCVRRWRYAS